MIYLLIDELTGEPILIKRNFKDIENYIKEKEDGHWDARSTIKISTEHLLEMIEESYVPS